MNEVKQGHLSRREFLKISSTLFSLALISILTGCNAFKDLLKKEEAKSTKYEIKDVDKDELKNTLQPQGWILNSKKSEWAFLQLPNVEKLHEEIINQSKISLEYEIDDYNFKFYAPENYNFPSQQTLDNVYNFLQKYHNGFYQRNVTKNNLEPREQSKYYIVDIPLKFTSEGKLDESGGPISATDKSLLHPNISHSIMNLAVDRDIPISSSFWVEFAQSLDASIEIKSWLDLYKAGSGSKVDILIAENRNNEFGIAAASITKGLSYDEYIKIAKVEGYVPAGTIILEPYSKEKYDDLVKALK